MNIKQFIPPILVDAWRAMKGAPQKKAAEFKIGAYPVDMPAGFALPYYQKDFKLYDRFLPILAKHLPDAGTIIDVGANIGDTVLALVQNCKCRIVSIEPSEIFFPYLEANVNKLTDSERSRVQLVKQFAGTGKLTGTLQHRGTGTAGLSVDNNSGTVTHKPLDGLVPEKTGITLLKADTDGFDFDVINSAPEILSSSKPILFWENYIENELQYEGFAEMYPLLDRQGYKYIYIFDNYGNLVTEEGDFSTLLHINSYLYSMKQYGCTRTFEYTDILAAADNHYPLVKQAIAEYKREVINKNA